MALNAKPVMLAMSTAMPHMMWMPPRVVAALTKQLFLVFDTRDGRGKVFSHGAGRGKGKNLRGGAGKGKGQNLRGGAGQNVSKSI